jgi:hypothetical protein
VIYRVLERDPKNRYANVHEFALDFGDLMRVGIAGRPELRDSKKRSAPPWRKVLLFVAIALVPIVIFGLAVLFCASLVSGGHADIALPCSPFSRSLKGTAMAD